MRVKNLLFAFGSISDIWILESGYWNDSKIWDDTKNWID